MGRYPIRSRLAAPEEKPCLGRKKENVKETEIRRGQKISFEKDVGRCIPPIGFTKREYQVVFSYMFRCSFELDDPIPENQRGYKAYMDQIRETRGYGVTIFEPCDYCCSLIFPMATPWKKDSMLKNYIPKMVETLFEAMENKFKVRFRNMEQELARNLEVIKNLELTNVVECSNVRVYLLSLGTPKLPEDGNVVEAMFAMVGNPVMADPVAPTNFVLKEWKLKRGGAHLVYSTTSTNGAMKEFARHCSPASGKQVC